MVSPSFGNGPQPRHSDVPPSDVVGSQDPAAKQDSHPKHLAEKESSLFQQYAARFHPTWLEDQRGRAGLQNLGNTCYCNSVLQCMAFIPPVGNLLRRDAHGLHGFACPWSAEGTCASCIMSKQLLGQLTSAGSFRPVSVVGNLHLFSKTFQRGRQEDSHEFFHCLLDAIERDCRKGLVARGVSKKNARTLVEDLFQGCTISQVRCLACGHESNTHEVFTSLSLDIGTAACIQDSFTQFTAPELLDGANKYKCDKCKCLVRARKQVAIYDQPNVLTLHLKRFNASPFSGGKVGRHVQFSSQLDLEPFSALNLLQLDSRHGHEHGHEHGHGYGHGHGHAVGSNGGIAASISQHGAKYHLTGVLVHQGSSVNSGHYYCFVKDSFGQWLCMNDESVARVRQEHVLSQQAYMLYYVRSAMKSPRRPPAAATAEAAKSTTPAAPGLFIGPQLPPQLLSAKRARDVDEHGMGAAAAGLTGHASGISNGSSSSCRAAASSTVMPSTMAKTVSLPPKVSMQTEKAAAAPLAPAPSFRLKKVALATKPAAKPPPALQPHAAEQGTRHATASAAAGPTAPAAAAAAEDRQHAKRPRTNGDTGGDLLQELRSSAAWVKGQADITATILNELRASEYKDALREHIAEFCSEAMEASQDTGSMETEQQRLDKLQQEVEHESSERAHALRQERIPLLRRIAPGVIRAAMDQLEALLKACISD